MLRSFILLLSFLHLQACQHSSSAGNSSSDGFTPLDSVLLETSSGDGNPPEGEPLPDISHFSVQDGYYVLDWDFLSLVQFEERYNEELEFEIPYPIFPPIIQAFDGQPILIQGYVIPLEETGQSELLVLSAFPFSSCFFCGSAGPESVMDIKLAKPSKSRFKMDNISSFRGTLRLNDHDIYYLNYILDDAEVVR
jgi:hypothetical protein